VRKESRCQGTALASVTTSYRSRAILQETMRVLLFACLSAYVEISFGQTFDLVLANGRIIDPESGLDAVRYVGILAGHVESISATPINGRAVVDIRVFRSASIGTPPTACVL
jgi:hypothetical protein